MVVLTLIAIGVVMIYSSTAIYAWERFKDGAYFLKRQLFCPYRGISLCLGDGG